MNILTGKNEQASNTDDDDDDDKTPDRAQNVEDIVPENDNDEDEAPEEELIKVTKYEKLTNDVNSPNFEYSQGSTIDGKKIDIISMFKNIDNIF